MRKKIILILLALLIVLGAFSFYHKDSIKKIYDALLFQFDENALALDEQSDFTNTWDFIYFHKWEFNNGIYIYDGTSLVYDVFVSYIKYPIKANRIFSDNCNTYEKQNLRNYYGYDTLDSELAKKSDFEKKFLKAKYSAITTEIGNVYLLIDDDLNILEMTVACDSMNMHFTSLKHNIDMHKIWKRLKIILPKCTQPKEELIDLAKFRTDCNFKSIGKPVQDSDSIQN